LAGGVVSLNGTNNNYYCESIAETGIFIPALIIIVAVLSAVLE